MFTSLKNKSMRNYKYPCYDFCVGVHTLLQRTNFVTGIFNL